jgi:hypothetical protein
VIGLDQGFGNREAKAGSTRPPNAPNGSHFKLFGQLPAIDGLMSMCISCHNMKHAGGIRGCDVDGMPLDPSHPWFVR